MQSHIRKVRACLAVTCHLHFWQNDRDLLRASAVTRGWNGYWNNSRQHRKLTTGNKILPPLLDGLEPATFQSRVRRSNHWVIPAPQWRGRVGGRVGGYLRFLRALELIAEWGDCRFSRNLNIYLQCGNGVEMLWVPRTQKLRPLSVQRFSLTPGIGQNVSDLFTCSIYCQFSSDRFKMISVRSEKPICAPAPPSLRSFPNVAFETVPIFVDGPLSSTARNSAKFSVSNFCPLFIQLY